MELMHKELTVRVIAAGSLGKWTRSVRIKVIIYIEIFVKLHNYHYLVAICLTEIPCVVKMTDKVYEKC